MLTATSYRVAKRHGRLHVVEGDASVYSPPDFLRPSIRGRQAIEDLAAAMNAGTPRIDAVIAFETALRPCKPRR